jgi:hypothetical protein
LSALSAFFAVKALFPLRSSRPLRQIASAFSFPITAMSGGHGNHARLLGVLPPATPKTKELRAVTPVLVWLSANGQVLMAKLSKNKDTSKPEVPKIYLR